MSSWERACTTYNTYTEVTPSIPPSGATHNKSVSKQRRLVLHQAHPNTRVFPGHQTHLQPQRFRQCACVPSSAAATSHPAIPHAAPNAGVNTAQQLRPASPIVPIRAASSPSHLLGPASGLLARRRRRQEGGQPASRDPRWTLGGVWPAGSFAPLVSHWGTRRLTRKMSLLLSCISDPHWKVFTQTNSRPLAVLWLRLAFFT